MTKPRKMRWLGHVVRMGWGRCTCRFWWENLRTRDHLGNMCLSWKVILKWLYNINQQNISFINQYF